MALFLPIRPSTTVRMGAVLASMVFAAIPATGLAQPVPAGTDIQVNTYTTNNQDSHDVVHLSDGTFVVIWSSVDQDGDGPGVFGRRLDTEGFALAGEFQVNSYTTGPQRFANVSASPSGGFVVVWLGRSAGSTGNYAVVGRQFDASAAPVGSEFEIAALGPPVVNSNRSRPSIDHAPDSGFTVVWADANFDSVLARRYDASATPLESEFQVNSYTTGGVAFARVSLDTTGNALVAWQSGDVTGFDGIDGSLSGIAAMRLDASGALVGTEFVLNSYTYREQTNLHVDHDGSGGFVVAWYRRYPDSRTLAQRYDASAAAVGTEFSVNGFGDYVIDDLAVAADGSFVVHANTKVREFDATGAALGEFFETRDHVTGGPVSQSFSVDEAGNFVVVWSESFNDAEREILARRFCSQTDPTCSICPGFDDSLDADGDGRPDGCDPCTNVGGGQDASKGAVRIRVNNDAGLPQRRSDITLSAEFALAGAPGAFASLDPVADGVRIRIETVFGAAIAETTLPGGEFAGAGTAGWKLNGAGTRWSYLDKRGLDPVPPFFKLVLKDVSDDGPNRVKLQARGREGTYAASPDYIPVRAFVVLGDSAASLGGLCGEVAFDLSRCDAKIGPGFLGPDADELSCKL